MQVDGDGLLIESDGVVMEDECLLEIAKACYWTAAFPGMRRSIGLSAHIGLQRIVTSVQSAPDIFIPIGNNRVHKWYTMR